MTKEEYFQMLGITKELVLYCLKSQIEMENEVCEECVKYENCTHSFLDKVFSKAVELIERNVKLNKALDRACEVLSKTDLKTTCDDKFKECKENYCIGENCVYSRKLTAEEWKECFFER